MSLIEIGGRRQGAMAMNGSKGQLFGYAREKEWKFADREGQRFHVDYGSDGQVSPSTRWRSRLKWLCGLACSEADFCRLFICRSRSIARSCRRNGRCEFSTRLRAQRPTACISSQRRCQSNCTKPMKASLSAPSWAHHPEIWPSSADSGTWPATRSRLTAPAS